MPSVKPFLSCAAWLLASALSGMALADVPESRCFGTPANGRLENGVSLPLGGENFDAYSFAGWTLGRTFVHGKVHAVLLAAFRTLETTAPDKVFVYGETGHKSGGVFKPHKTHRNGLSVDLMVPVLRDDESVPLPGSMFNRYGYDIEFDDDGRYEDYRIDFEALAELIHAIDNAAKAAGIGIARVIFEVPLQRHLWTTSRGAYLKRHVRFSTRAAWVRHDEHIHIDFDVRCA
jgi:penicillin-insensitive murein endopeptidase